MISEIYNLQDYETAAEEDPYYQYGQQLLLDGITKEVGGQTAKILEIGGGSGSFTEKLAQSLAGADIHVIEPDQEWFTVLKARMAKFANVQCRLTTLKELDDRSYDICCASFAFHHIPYEEQAANAEKILGVLRNGSHLLILDKYIPSFSSEFERRVALKTYHGYFLTYKKLRNLNKAAEFEVASLESNLLKEGDYKLSTTMLESCLNKFKLIEKTKIVPLKINIEIKTKVVENLHEAGFSVSKKEARMILRNLELQNWGMFVHTFRKRN
jgi:ubiquinone/menaquinone biosynthesis C-methylase UbiE